MKENSAQFFEIAIKIKDINELDTFEVSEIYSRLSRENSPSASSIQKELNKKKFHIDHIIPLACGGTNDENNLQLLCVFQRL
jgi:hypothetical protein